MPSDHQNAAAELSYSAALPLSLPIEMERIPGSHLYLRILRVEEVGEPYCRWMNDPEIVRFTESRFQTYGIDELKSYVQQMDSDPSIAMWAICRDEDDFHIGNIKLGPVNWQHRFGDIGLIIGERSAWGKGYATEAISAVCAYAFDVLKLHKMTASMYEQNVGSHKAFLKAGFHEEGRRTSQYLCDEEYTDLIMMGRWRDNIDK